MAIGFNSAPALLLCHGALPQPLVLCRVYLGRSDRALPCRSPERFGVFRRRSDQNSHQPASWRAFTKPTSRRAQPEEPAALDFGARAQDFLKRITPLSADLAAHGRTRTLALQKLHRICQAEVRTLKARYTLATVKLALSKYRNAIRAVDPDHLVLRPRKMRSGQRFSYLALDPEETRALNAAYHQRIHHDQSNLIPLDPETFIQTALELLASDRYLQKGMGLMALTGRRPAEIFFSQIQPPSEKTPLSRPHLRRPTQNLVRLPAPASSLTSSPSWPTPRKLSCPRPTPIVKELLPPRPLTPSPTLVSFAVKSLTGAFGGAFCS
jgi:hypothetical protein